MPTRLRPRAPTSLPVALRLALAFALPWVGACGGPPDSDPFVRQGQGRSEIRIEVTNVNYMDATLRALYDGRRQRLGIVTGASTAVFTLEWPNQTPLQIEIDLLAGGACVTRELLVSPGQELTLRIESDLRMMQDCY